MSYLTVGHMAKFATLDAVTKGPDKNGTHSGHFEVTSPDGLSKLVAHSWELAGVTFHVKYRETTRIEHWGTYSASWDFAKGFLTALNIPVKE
jgi:hypothetical protein